MIVGSMVGVGSCIGVAVMATVTVGCWVGSRTDALSLEPPPATAATMLIAMNAAPPKMGPFHHQDSLQKRRNPSRISCMIWSNWPVGLCSLTEGPLLSLRAGVPGKRDCAPG